MIRFTCYSCKTLLQSGDDRGGVLVGCPNCKSQMKVPSPSVTPPAGAVPTVSNTAGMTETGRPASVPSSPQPVEARLRELLTKHGAGLCSDTRRCESMIRDICGDKTKEAHLLIQVLKQKALVDLIGMSLGTAPLPTLRRLRQRLEDAVGMAESAASWAINSWAMALGIVIEKDLRHEAVEITKAEAVIAIPAATGDISLFKNLKAPLGEKNPSVIFHQIRLEMDDIFNKARVKFDQGDLGLVGSGAIYPRVFKLTQLNEYEKISSKKLTEFKDTDKWFFIGDIHGDFLALHSILEEIKKEPDFKICFLGDLVDRGPYDAECFALLLKTTIEYPGRIIWILGNHDEGIQKTNLDILNKKDSFPEDLHSPLKEIRKCIPPFNSSISPSEFLFWLNFNDPKLKKGRIFCGNLFVDIASVLPRAILFPSGLLATHGGFPLSDMWDSLTNMGAFLHKRCLTDFTWNSASNAKKRLIAKAERPRQSSWGFGYEDLEKFCEKVKDLFPVKAVIRGHDHVKEGWENFDLYKKVPLLTLNSFGFNYLNYSLIEGHYKQNFVFYGVSKDKILPNIRKLIPVDSQTHKEFYAQRAFL